MINTIIFIVCTFAFAIPMVGNAVNATKIVRKALGESGITRVDGFVHAIYNATCALFWLVCLCTNLLWYTIVAFAV